MNKISESKAGGTQASSSSTKQTHMKKRSGRKSKAPSSNKNRKSGGKKSQFAINRPHLLGDVTLPDLDGKIIWQESNQGDVLRQVLQVIDVHFFHQTDLKEIKVHKKRCLFRKAFNQKLMTEIFPEISFTTTGIIEEATMVYGAREGENFVYVKSVAANIEGADQILFNDDRPVDGTVTLITPSHRLTFGVSINLHLEFSTTEEVDLSRIIGELPEISAEATSDIPEELLVEVTDEVPLPIQETAQLWHFSSRFLDDWFVYVPMHIEFDMEEDLYLFSIVLGFWYAGIIIFSVLMTPFNLLYCFVKAMAKIASFTVSYLSRLYDDYMFRWHFYYVTGEYPEFDLKLRSDFLNVDGAIDHAAHSRYTAAILDAAVAEKPDVTHLLRSFSGTGHQNLTEKVLTDLVKAPPLRKQVDAAVKWSQYSMSHISVPHHIRIFTVSAVLFLIYPIIVKVMPYILVYSALLIFSILKDFGRIVNLDFGALLTYEPGTALEFAHNYKYYMFAVPNVTAEEVVINCAHVPEEYDFHGEMTLMFVWCVLIIPIVEEWLKRKLIPKLLESSGLSVNSIFIHSLYGLFEGYMKAKAVGGRILDVPFFNMVFKNSHMKNRLLIHWFMHFSLAGWSFFWGTLVHIYYNLVIFSSYYEYFRLVFERTMAQCPYDPFVELPRDDWWGSKHIRDHRGLFSMIPMLSVQDLLLVIDNYFYRGAEYIFGVDFDLMASPSTILLSLIITLTVVALHYIYKKISNNNNHGLQYCEKAVSFQEYLRNPSPSAGIMIIPVCVGEVKSQLGPGNKVYMSTGAHRKGARLGYFSTGLNLSKSVPFNFSGCHHNCNAAGVYRMAGLPKRYKKPYGSTEDYDAVADLWENVLMPYALKNLAASRPDLIDRGVYGEITHHQWAAKFNLAQAENLFREYRLGNRSTVFDMFVKKEKSVALTQEDEDWASVETDVEDDLCKILSPGKVNFHPRGISVPKADVRVHFGPSSHRLANYLKLRFSGRCLFAGGLTRREFSKWYEQVIYMEGRSFANVGDDLLEIEVRGGNCVIHSVDASRFDQHVLPCILEFNAAIYKALGMTEEYVYSKQTINKTYTIRPGDGGVKGKIKVIGTQASGKWDTLGGNSLPMLFCAEYADHTGRSLSTLLFEAGFVSTGPTCQALDLKADFLQNLPYQSLDDGVRFGPKIGRILGRTFWYESKLKPEHCLPFCLGVLVGLANDIMHIPILNDLFCRLQELVNKPWYPKKVSVHSFKTSELPAKEHPETMSLLALRYDVSVCELTAYRHFLRSWEPNMMLDAGFENLLYRIVGTDCNW